MSLLLDGVRVLSLAHQYPGPYATMLMSDLGADVVLVERPDGGDQARAFPGFHNSLARGKRSIALDLKSEQGRELLLTLVKQTDVVVEGFRPGTMDRLGIGQRVLTEVRPELVYVSVSGYGQTGPYAARPGHDLTYQAEAGMLYEHAASAQPPEAPALELGDLIAGLLTVQAVLGGLLRREREHRGAVLDVSMFDGLVSLLTTHLGPVVNDEGPPGFPYEPGYGVFQARDGALLALGVAHEDHFWRELCVVTGLDADRDLTAAERFGDHERLRCALQTALSRRTGAEWEKLFDAHDVPYGRVRSLEEAAQSPHTRARGLLHEVLGSGESRQYVRQPLGIDGAGPGPRGGVPKLGEHTVEVLSDAGVSGALIAAALEGNVAMQPPNSEK